MGWSVYLLLVYIYIKFLYAIFYLWSSLLLLLVCDCQCRTNSWCFDLASVLEDSLCDSCSINWLLISYIPLPQVIYFYRLYHERLGTNSGHHCCFLNKVGIRVYHMSSSLITIVTKKVWRWHHLRCYMVRCRTLLFWNEMGERQVFGPDIL